MRKGLQTLKSFKYRYRQVALNFYFPIASIFFHVFFSHSVPIEYRNQEGTLQANKNCS